jgi:hypothetical protein
MSAGSSSESKSCSMIGTAARRHEVFSTVIDSSASSKMNRKSRSRVPLLSVSSEIGIGLTAMPIRDADVTSAPSG